MIEYYFERPHAIARMRSVCTGAHIDAFADALTALGYTRNGGRALLRGVTHLGAWLDANEFDISALDEPMLKKFVAGIKEQSAGEGKPRHCHAGGLRFLNWARERSVVSTSPPVPPEPELLREFIEWMRHQRNLAEATIKGYRLPLRRFVAELGDDPSRYAAADIRRFVLRESQRAGRGYAQLAVSALRMFFRYLAIGGQVGPELVDAVPSIANWALASLPMHLRPAEVEQLIGACDPDTPCGSRDRAMILLMAVLGLRSGDLVQLRLGDIDWKTATLSLSGKSRTASRLPLPQEAGDALLYWITTGRSEHPNDDNRVFLRMRPPIGPITNVAVYNVVAAAAKRAGLEAPRVGPRMLRHSAATSLLRQGASLPTIGAVLRHRSIDTTAIYAKVDIDLLASIAQPWPEEGSP